MNKPPHVEHVQAPTVICAWCKKTLVKGNPELISHGQCPDCHKISMAQLEELRNCPDIRSRLTTILKHNALKHG